MRHTRFLLLAALALLALAACASQPRDLSAADAAAFSAEVDAVVEGTLQGLSAGDYALYTAHFDQAMLDATTPEAFDDLHALITDKVGAYQSREVDRVFDQGDYRVIIYRAVFEMDDPVLVRVVFHRDDPAGGITGLWFDSDKLRE
jgi:hypothetical protein